MQLRLIILETYIMHRRRKHYKSGGANCVIVRMQNTREIFSPAP